MKDGVIADYRITEQMLNYFIKKVHGAKLFTPGPRIVICVPTSSTLVDRRAIRESALAAGATKVYLIEEPMAAAIGCDLPVHEPSGSMILDIGGGTAEIGVISLGGMVFGRSIPIGGDSFDRAIIDYVRRQHGIAIGETTSERNKKQIAVAHPSLYDTENSEIRVSGQNVAEGVPRQFTLSSKEVHDAIKMPAEEIIKGVRTALENVPPRTGLRYFRAWHCANRRRRINSRIRYFNYGENRRAGQSCRRPFNLRSTRLWNGFKFR